MQGRTQVTSARASGEATKVSGVHGETFLWPPISSGHHGQLSLEQLSSTSTAKEQHPCVSAVCLCHRGLCALLSYSDLQVWVLRLADGWILSSQHSARPAAGGQ